MQKPLRFAVFGGGSWATAIVKMLCDNQENVVWYMRNTDAIGFIKIQKHNPNYLTSVTFNTEKLFLTANINEAVNNADILIFAIPSAFLHTELQKLTAPIKEKIIFQPSRASYPKQDVS